MNIWLKASRWSLDDAKRPMDKQMETETDLMIYAIIWSSVQLHFPWVRLSLDNFEIEVVDSSEGVELSLVDPDEGAVASDGHFTLP